MRLDGTEKRGLEKALMDVEGEVFLYGSRVDDSRRGGDIDLLIRSGEDPYRLAQKVRRDFRMICDEKIDVLVLPEKGLSREQKAFLKTLTLERIK
jgi:predicted nucleotidyltransferase